MRLSRTVSYAVQATLALSQKANRRPISCREIAQTGEMPERFLLQILRNLVTHGILVSTRGVDGGYTLNRSAEEITLLNLVEALEGSISGSVSTGGTLPEEIQAELRGICEDIAALTRDRLDKVTLNDLVPGAPRANRVRQAPRPIIVSLVPSKAGENSVTSALLDGRQHDHHA